VTKQRIGRLEKVVLNEAWGNNTRYFIDWLKEADNNGFLGGAIGRNLKLLNDPDKTLPGKADVCYQDSDSEAVVLVKIAFDESPESQLGQLLTAAAGSRGAVLVWIADHIDEDKVSAIEWLNAITNDQVEIFGLEIDFWRIGDSPYAPTLTMVAKPKRWAKKKPAGDQRVLPASIKSTVGGITAKAEPAQAASAAYGARPAASATAQPAPAQPPLATRSPDLELPKPTPTVLEYWMAFNGSLIQRHSTVIGQKPVPQNWMIFPLSGSHAHLIALVSQRDQYIAVGLLLTGEDAKTHFQLLQHSKVAIENEIAASLEWQELPDKSECRILLRRFGVDPDDRGQWADQHEWMGEKLERFQKAFVLRVEALYHDEDDSDLDLDVDLTEKRSGKPDGGMENVSLSK
jgi:hypothetical protein